MLKAVSKELEDTIKPDTLFISETIPHENPDLIWYQVVYLPKNYDDGITFMRNAKTNNRLELWTQYWTNTENGYAPMAYRKASV